MKVKLSPAKRLKKKVRQVSLQNGLPPTEGVQIEPGVISFSPGEEVVRSEVEPVVVEKVEPEPLPPVSEEVNDQITQLLLKSLNAHQRASVPSRSQHRTTWWKDDYREAAQARLEAERLDPEFRSPVWAGEARITPSDVNTHEAFMTFYREKGVI